MDARDVARSLFPIWDRIPVEVRREALRADYRWAKGEFSRILGYEPDVLVDPAGRCPWGIAVAAMGVEHPRPTPTLIANALCDAGIISKREYPDVHRELARFIELFDKGALNNDLLAAALRLENDETRREVDHSE